MEHQFQPATCTKASTCALCQATKGNPLAHQYLDATCTDPRICSICQMTDSAPLGHTPGELNVIENHLLGTRTQLQNCTVCSAELINETGPVSMIRDGFYLLCADSTIMRLNAVYEALGKSGWYALAQEHTYSNGETVLKGYIYNREIKYAEILFKTPNQDPAPEEMLIEIKPEQCYDPILCQLTVYINFYDIAKQRANLDPTLTEDNVMDTADAIVEVLNTAEALYYDVVAPVLIACDPSLTDEQIDTSFDVYKTNTFHTSQNLGDLFIEYGNFFMLIYSHAVSISSTDAYSIENQIGTGS